MDNSLYSRCRRGGDMGSGKVERYDMDASTGEIWTEVEMHDYYTTHTVDEIKEFEKKIVRIEGDPETIADISSKLAVDRDNLDRLRIQARKRAMRKMK